MKTYRGVTYWPTYDSAIAYANGHNLPVDRLIEYGRGWAIQKCVSGPYWNAVKEVWQ